MADPSASTRGALVGWLVERGLLLGPFLYVDYWANVLGLGGDRSSGHEARGWVDAALFRAGVHRPDLELPRLRYYVALLLIGPLLLPFRTFRRLGRYPIRHRRDVGDELAARLAPYELELEAEDDGRVTVRKGGTTFATGVLDPRRIAAFSSLFYATYKLPIATVTAIVTMAVLVPVLGQAGLLDQALQLWFPVFLPATAAFLYVLYRDLPTAVLGAVPVLAGGLVVAAFGDPMRWGQFLAALAILLAVALLADWFFVPRPVPPSLHLYTKDGPGRAFDREEDAPYWLEGEAYWVWRYLMLVPAEVNKFWERDWERAEIWIRADGPDAGRLEWVVVDAHYRELWIPYERLGASPRLERQTEAGLERASGEGTGLWLVEVDANLLFHAPFVRTVTFVPEGEDVPISSLWHLLNGLFRRGSRDDPTAYLGLLDGLRLARGRRVLDDLPEAIIPLAIRHMLGTPWRYWRYPLGAHRKREPRVYDEPGHDARAAIADPELQIKARAGEGA